MIIKYNFDRGGQYSIIGLLDDIELNNLEPEEVDEFKKLKFSLNIIFNEKDMLQEIIDNKRSLEKKRKTGEKSKYVMD